MIKKLFSLIASDEVADRLLDFLEDKLPLSETPAKNNDEPEYRDSRINKKTASYANVGNASYMSHCQFKYQLESDECVILQNDFVFISGSLECVAKVVLLTSKNLVIEYEGRSWKSQYYIVKYPLSEIKKYKNDLQIFPCKKSSEPCLEIYFANAHLFLHFSNVGSKHKQRLCIDQWIAKTTEVFFDLPPSDDSERNGSNKKSRICKCCGKELPWNLRFCTQCGTATEK